MSGTPTPEMRDDRSFQLPQTYAARPAVEIGEFWWLRRMDWEVIRRCVKRLKKADTFTASWLSFLIGLGVSALVSLATVRYTVATQRVPHDGTQVFLALLAVFAFVTSFIVGMIEGRERENRAEPIDALKQELDAAERYMKELEELK